MDEPEGDASLDPVPWVWPSGTRSMFSSGDGKQLTFAPREGYEQEWEKYLPHLKRF